ncbi:MAG TPA: hypothetical protein VNQ90_16445, partial [Chthoniobacteraceae bacterium]|nr:hypothetical protein [Chthoniobacteraceae bacterium]
MNFPYRCLAPALRHLLAGGLLAVAAAGLQAQVVYTTDNEPGDWNDPGFWSRTPAVEDPEHPEALYPHLDGDQAVITGSSGNRNISMGEDIVLERLSVEGGRSFVPDGVSQVNITLRADLNRTESVPMFQVGSSGISTKASLTLPSGVHIHLIGGVMNFGGGPRGGNVEVTLQAGSSLSAGTLLNRTEWLMGRQSSTNRSDIRVSTLNSEAGSAFTGYFSSVKIGAVEGANALSSITGQADLRLATVHAFDVSGDVSIGKGAALGGNYGELRLPRV